MQADVEKEVDVDKGDESDDSEGGEMRWDEL